MKDAILITDSMFELSDFKLYTQSLFNFNEASESEIEYFAPNEYNSYLSISKDNSIFKLIEPCIQQIIQSEFDVFSIFVCLFYDFSYVQRLAASIPPNRKILIDNDHGTIMNRTDFLKLESYRDFVKRM